MSFDSHFSLDTPDQITDFYNARASTGDGASASGWGSAEMQLRRWQVLLEIGDWRDKSILDVGCGLGGLSDLLPEGHDYVGIDLSAVAIESARRLRPDREFYCVTDEVPLPRMDLVCASGVFTHVSVRPSALIRAWWDAAEWGVAFNALSVYSGDTRPSERPLDPEAVLAWCRTELDSGAQMRHDYHAQPEFDFTVYLRKP